MKFVAKVSSTSSEDYVVILPGDALTPAAPSAKRRVHVYSSALSQPSLEKGAEVTVPQETRSQEARSSAPDQVRERSGFQGRGWDRNCYQHINSLRILQIQPKGKEPAPEGLMKGALSVAASAYKDPVCWTTLI
uniref:Uncharacterized protein n=1 Tax=Sphaerodactylus townsendi TaxID=933632 RepID=A0ACB8ETM8_9SAUR